MKTYPVALSQKSAILLSCFCVDVIVELKSVEKVSGAHKKQVQTYLKLTGLKLGFLMNFNEELIKHGITRCVNQLEE